MLRQGEKKQQRVYKQRFRTDKFLKTGLRLIYYITIVFIQQIYTSCVNISLSDYKKTQWFQCPLCDDVKFFNKATIANGLVLNIYVKTAISNVQVLKRVPKDSRVPLAESLSDKINDIV